MTVVVDLTCSTCGKPLREHLGPGSCPPIVPGCDHLMRDARALAAEGCICCRALIEEAEAC